LFRRGHPGLYQIILRNEGRIQALIIGSKIVSALAEIAVASDKTSDVILHILRVLVDWLLLMLLHLLLLLLDLLNHVVVRIDHRILTHQIVPSRTLVLLIVQVVAHHRVLCK
jgi:hypothetical protein